ncbi:hypothetical protein LTS18_001995 [Coniosporium uncinatum]|uniref:Uncharacterized protein n=1 Tax=Coniosporium uncinatum TaxID=93489 RepID=A0ACC3DZB1_9PEZI|nr:hypothetical protein LTS18_001995 [Coniosporium uncinatum]
MIFHTVLIVLLALVAGQSAAQSYYGPEDPRIEVAVTTETPINGVSTRPGGRLFVLYARVDGSSGPQVVEYNQTTNETVPFPNEEWNSYAPGKNPATHLVRTNSQRIGPDGQLWIVDVGSPGFGEPVILPEGPKLVAFNLTTNEVSRVYPMGNVTRSMSLLDDVRFNLASDKAYLTDAGRPGLIVLDLASEDAGRVLDDDLSTRQYLPMEVSPNGKWFYYQPASGGFSRIETRYLDNAFYNSSLNSNAILGQYVEPFAHTPSTGGTAVDANGNVYDSDTDSQRIIKIAPNGTMTTLVQDPRLLWVDAMWIDTQQRLWMPAAQLNRGIPFNNGTTRIVKPLYVYTIDIGVGPPAIDHA